MALETTLRGRGKTTLPFQFEDVHSHLLLHVCLSLLHWFLPAYVPFSRPLSTHPDCFLIDHCLGWSII